MTEPREPQLDDGLSPAVLDPAEGAREPDGGAEPPAKEVKGPPGHLGPAGDPAEGKES